MLERKSLAQGVADTLQEKIEQQEYPLETKLPSEPELMELFSVGRSTIREAIRILANSGFVRVQQGLGTFIKSTRPNDPIDARLAKSATDEIQEVRQLLELKIVEKAVLNRSATDLKKMQVYLQTRKQAALKNDLEACLNADVNFHTVIAESCGNSLLAEMYKVASAHLAKSFKIQYKSTTAFQESQGLHEALFQHIKEQDSKKAIIVTKKIIAGI